MNSMGTRKVLKRAAAATGFVVILFAPTGCLVSGTTAGTTGGTTGGTVGGTLGGIIGGITGALGL